MRRKKDTLLDNAQTLEGAYEKIRRAGLTPIDMSWYVRKGYRVDGVSSVETLGPATFGSPRLYVAIIPLA